ncbi:LysR family transcriptional regulator [Amycolatopsis cynarae]|uniref:LysR family transcriptional regulator n=1 Tax=Amycolatopsis cynarae TaxID=2995223 RepID=A0ABY7BE89_9PSEU|nr:LysR family transcriptional regulator [Amycolatopsis sp. HUAS 11-8]WAL69226.1 LysR family transcriptional regulator [Amycolatopsis sp. HUAS 11-8]
MPHKNSDGSGALDLMLLRTFLAVHRAGSFTAAARLLGLSQPAVTGQIRALEEQLGRPLFERLPRGVAATTVADELAAEIAVPLDRLAAVAGRGRAADGPADDDVLPEPVHLGGPAELLGVRVLPALAPLVAGGLRLRVTPGLADDLLEGLRAGQFDLVVSAIRPRGRSILATPLMDEEFVLVAAPAWAARLGALSARDPGPLRTVPLITYAEDLPIARRYWRHVFGTRLDTQAAVVVPDLRAVRAAVAAGAGFSVLPRYLCDDDLVSGTLVTLLEPEDPPLNTGFLAQRAGARASAQVLLVRDHLLQQAKSW